MRVPIRQGGEFTNMAHDPNLTKDKFNELTNKLARLRAQLPEAISEVKIHGELGDFSENAAYQMAKGKLRSLNERVADLEKHLGQAIIINRVVNGQVQLGSQVKLKINGQEKTYLILGSSEADLQKNIISHNSPIGSALMGKKAGTGFQVVLADKDIVGEILEIS